MLRSVFIRATLVAVAWHATVSAREVSPAAWRTGTKGE